MINTTIELFTNYQNEDATIQGIKSIHQKDEKRIASSG